MIVSFRHKGLEKFFFEGTRKGIQPQHAQKLANILDRLDAAAEIRDMNFPGSHLHELKGKDKGYWSIRVSGNWRIVFKFQNEEALEVNYVDYH